MIRKFICFDPIDGTADGGLAINTEKIISVHLVKGKLTIRVDGGTVLNIGNADPKTYNQICDHLLQIGVSNGT